jgi:hypothetical protein
LSTDLTLDANEIIRIYGMRWSIETFFKFTKSHLKLGTEFQGRSFTPPWRPPKKSVLYS